MRVPTLLPTLGAVFLLAACGSPPAPPSVGGGTPPTGPTGTHRVTTQPPTRTAAPTALPATSVPSTQAGLPFATLAGGLRRSLDIPPLAPDGRCPVSASEVTVSGFGAFQGSGPVYVTGPNNSPLAALPFQDGWYGQKVFWAVDPREPGPILVRVARIDGAAEVSLGDTGSTSPEVLLREPISITNDASPSPLRIFSGGINFRVPGC
jgi:hypothetical protein